VSSVASRIHEAFRTLVSSRTESVLFIITEIISLTTFAHLMDVAISRRIILTSTKWQIGLALLGTLCLVEAAVLLSLLLRVSDQLERLISDSVNAVARFGYLRIPVFVLLLLVPGYLFLLFGQINDIFFADLLVRVFISWIFILAASVILLSYRFRFPPLAIVASVALLLGFIHRMNLLFQGVNAYPFSLGWSEASRYYYASLFFSKSIYGFKVPPSVLHPTRYLLQSLPFLISGLPIIVHRFWQAVLWIVATTLTGYVLGRRIELRPRRRMVAFVLLAALFLFQGPVYYHLLVMVIIILWSFDGQKPQRSLVIILLASIWAGISRINWFPMPALLGATLYLLEIPRRDRDLVDYGIWPAIWFVLGTATAFLSQAAYIAWSGQPTSQFSSSFSSGLLWYRLFPSATYPLGILRATLLVSLPFIFILWLRRREVLGKVHTLRIVGLSLICLVLLAGGLIVSVKIGGGSNLHNLDAYLVCIGILSAYLYFDRFAADEEIEVQAQRASPLLTAFVLAVPIMFTLSEGQPVSLPPAPVIQKSLQEIRDHVELGDPDSEVLFISQRHLLTFHLVEGVRLVPDYETVFLMEMAMAHNEEYLSAFHDDLAEHRFEVIVVSPLNTFLQGRSHSFGEENNAWVREVSLPLLCYYDVAETLPETAVQVLTPRLKSCLE
jgi:hypothetical protein